MKLEQFIEERMKRIMSIVEHSTIKIVKKEIQKIKKDLKKELLNKLKQNGKSKT